MAHAEQGVSCKQGSEKAQHTRGEAGTTDTGMRFGQSQDAVSYTHLDVYKRQGFEEAVVERIGTFLAALDDGFGAIREPGDLFGEQLIPKLPAQVRREQLGDFASAASVLPFHCDDFDHVGSYVDDSPHAMLLHIILLLRHRFA